MGIWDLFRCGKRRSCHTGAGVSAADGLMNSIRKSGSAAWFITGCTMPAHIKAALDRVL